MNQKVLTLFTALDRAVPLHPLRDEDEYQSVITVLEALLNAGGADENQPIAVLVQLLGERIEEYEQRHHRLPEALPGLALQSFLEERGVKPSDLPEIGAPEVVAEILVGNRELDARQIRALADRFSVNPAAFA